MAQEQNQSNQQQNQAQQYAQDKTKQIGQRGGKRVAGKAARNAARATRATVQAVRVGVQVGAQAVTAVATSETWAIPAAIIIGVVLLFIVITAILTPILGSDSQVPVCDGITIRATEPISLTATNCSLGTKALVYRWDSSGTGLFSSPQSQIMTYSPSAEDSGQVITISLVVCEAAKPDNCSETYATTITISADAASPPTTGTSVPTCPTGNYLSCLKTQFGITMHGSYTNSQLKIIYSGFAIGFKYPTFLKWFKSVTPDVTVSSYNVCPASMWCGGAWATVETGAKMTLYQNFLSSGASYRNYILVHEAAHMAAQANQNSSNTQYTLYDNAYTERRDRDCYNSKGVIKTYPINVIPSSQLNFGRKVRESWAESVVDTVLCKAGSTCPSHGGGGTSINNFPTTCSYIYNFVKNALD